MGSRLHVAVAHSDDVDEADVAAEVMDSIQEQLGGPPDAAFLFSTATYDNVTILAVIRSRWPQVTIAGGTGNGVFTHTRGCLDDSVGMMAFKSDIVAFSGGFSKGYGEDSFSTTLDALNQAQQGHSGTPSAIFAFPTGLGGNADAAIAAVKHKFGEGVPLFGGLVGDDLKMDVAYTFGTHDTATNAIAVLCVWGEFRTTSGTASGGGRLGPTLEVTDVRDNVIYTLDGKPAFEKAAHYLGDRRDVKTRGFNLGVLAQDSDEIAYLRSVVTDINNQGSITFTGEIPHGSRVAIAVGDRDGYLRGARESVELGFASWSVEEPPSGVLVASCAGRRWVMGRDATKEWDTINTFLKEKGYDIPVIGMFSFGELAPIDGVNRYHNETCVIVPFSARK